MGCVAVCVCVCGWAGVCDVSVSMRCQNFTLSPEVKVSEVFSFLIGRCAWTLMLLTGNDRLNFKMH